MAEAATELNVFKAASLCSQAFIKYSDASNGTIKDEIDVLQGRFNLWAAYTGVFAPVGASLDDRLEFQDDVKQMVVKLLSMVHRNIQCGIVNERQGGRPSPDRVAVGARPALIPSGALFCGFDAVSAALDRLHRLATAIRRSSLESQKDKLHNNTQASEVDAHVELCLFRVVRDRFPAARISLLKQVAAVLCFYRKRLLYLPRHNKKLANRQRLTARPQVDKGKSSLSRQVHLAHLPKLQSFPDANADFTRTVTLSQTDASIPNSQQLRRGLIKPTKTVTSTASVLSVSLGEKIYHPDLPLFPKDAKFHPCPYCAEPLPTFKLSGGALGLKFWRDHINRDLEPYFCISEDCREPLRLFSRFEDWSEHMNTTHTPEWNQYVHSTTWVCQMCRKSQDIIQEKGDFELHIRESHANLTITQTIARTKRSKTKVLRDPFACPFCEAVPPQLAAMKTYHHNPQSRAMLAKHIGFHVKALSHMCFRLLPSNEEDGDNPEGLSDSGKYESTNTQTRRSLTAVDGTSSSEARDSAGSPPYTFGPGAEETVSLQEINEMSEVESWDFIPGFQHLHRTVIENLSKGPLVTLRGEAEGPDRGGEQENPDLPDVRDPETSAHFSDAFMDSVPAHSPTADANFMKGFSCCGTTLPTLHDLLQHYEEKHYADSLKEDQRRSNESKEDKVHHGATLSQPRDADKAPWYDPDSWGVLDQQASSLTIDPGLISTLGSRDISGFEPGELSGRDAEYVNGERPIDLNMSGTSQIYHPQSQGTVPPGPDYRFSILERLRKPTVPTADYFPPASRPAPSNPADLTDYLSPLLREFNPLEDSFRLTNFLRSQRNDESTPARR